MKFQLKPEDHERISNLCGPTNSTLKQIEKELKIKIINRGSQFKIEGDTPKAELAKDIILKIYGELEKDKVIEPSDIHLYLMTDISITNSCKCYNSPPKCMKECIYPVRL